MIIAMLARVGSTPWLGWNLLAQIKIESCKTQSLPRPCTGQQRGFPLRRYFIPGCVGRGLDRSGFESSAGAGYVGAVVESGIPSLGIEAKIHGFPTAWLITSRKFQGGGHLSLIHI